MSDQMTASQAENCLSLAMIEFGRIQALLGALKLSCFSQLEKQREDHGPMESILALVEVTELLSAATSKALEPVETFLCRQRLRGTEQPAENLSLMDLGNLRRYLKELNNLLVRQGNRNDAAEALVLRIGRVISRSGGDDGSPAD